MNSIRTMKMMIAVIVILVLILSIISYQFFQQKQEKNRQWQSFLNQFYFSVHESLNQMDYLIENKPTNVKLEEAMKEVEKSLLNADLILENGNNFLNDKIHNTRFFQEITYFLYGLKMNGLDTVEIPPLAEDHQLVEKEVILLKTIRGYLAEVKQQMYSEETKQENPNLTIDEFNEAIAPYINKSSAEVYSEVYP